MTKLLFTFLAAMCCMAMNAQTTFEVAGINYSVTGDNTVEVVEKKQFYSGTVAIPPTVTYSNTTYNVIGIGDNAFQTCTQLTSVTLPEGITSIGASAFRACYNLTSITLPEGITSIGASAFRACRNLTSITIPESVTCIKNEAFSQCVSLTSLTIPEKVTSIENGVFLSCTGLASIMVAEKNTVYESPNNCNAIIEKSTHTLLAGCKNTVIPNTVTSINSEAFRNHEGLTSITIPESVTSIGYGAFWSTGLTKVEIGKSVETIGMNAFKNCTHMTEIYVLATTPPTLGENAFDMVPIDIPVYVPNVEIYTGWGGFTNLITNVDLPTAKEEAIADLQTFINGEKIANPPMEEYADRINAVVFGNDLSSIVNEIKAEISDYTKFTLGEWKYLLDKNDGKYTIVGGSLTFTDKDIYQCDYDFTANNLTYSRTFANTNWQALYVPFAMSYADWSATYDVAAINNFHEYTDADGKTVKIELEVRLVKSGSLKPNHPYLIRAKAGGESGMTLTPRALYRAKENSIVCSSVETKYTFTGTYHSINRLKTNDYVFMSGGNLAKAMDDDAVLSPQRWYLTIENLGSQIDNDESDGGSKARAMSVVIRVLNDEATDIDEITVSRTPLNADHTAIYNLNGMRVSDDYKGIVIKNGKKYYQK